MKKDKIKNKLILITILLSITLVISTSGTVTATEYTVDGSSGADFTSIQAAIDHTTTDAGDTIIVNSGEYVENITIYKEIILKGNETDGTKPIINGNETGNTVEVNADNVEVTGFKITNSSNEHSGIYIQSNDNSTIYNNTITTNNYGVSLDPSSNNTITNNNITENSNDGIRISDSSNNTINGSNIIKKNGGNGVIIHDSNNNKITGNSIKNNAFIGIFIEDSINNNVTRNVIANHSSEELKNGGIKVKSSSSPSNYNSFIGNNITNNSNNGINLAGNYTTIRDNRIINNERDGIYLSRSQHNNLTDNFIKNNIRYGLQLASGSNNNNISKNDFILDGLYVDSSYNNIVPIEDSLNNTVNGEKLVYYEDVKDPFIPEPVGQIVLVSTEDVTIDNREISNTDTAIQLLKTNNTKIKNSNITNNYYNGIELHNSNNTVIQSSKVTSNGLVKTGETKGIYLSGTKDTIIQSNNITNNYFNGIRLKNTNNTEILSNNITKTHKAIDYQGLGNGIGLMFFSNNVFVKDNKFTENPYGIMMAGQSNSIEDNKITNNDLLGIWLYQTTNSIIKGNLIAENNINNLSYAPTNPAVLLSSSQYNSITKNNIKNNYKSGIGLSKSSYNNITKNNIKNNDQDEIFITGSKNNNIYLNSFIDENIDIVSDSDNTWNSTEKVSYTYNEGSHQKVVGNYWSDYTGSDSNNDGIWDGTYTVSGDVGNDTAPLVEPIENYLIGEVDVSKTYGVSIKSDSRSESVGLNNNASYSLTVENTGNQEDDFDLVLVNPRANATLEHETLTLSPGSSESVNLNVSSGFPGSFDVSVSAISSGSGKMDTAMTSTVVQGYGLIMSADSTTSTVDPDSQGIYSLTVKNTGNVRDTYDVEIVRDDEDLALPEGSLTVGPIVPGGTGSAEISLSAPASGTYRATVNASSTNNTNKWTTKTLELNVDEDNDPGVSLSIDSVTRKVERDGESTYIVSVRNTGNVEDTYTLTTESDAATSLGTNSMTLGPSESKSITLTVSNLNEFRNYGTSVRVDSDNYDVSSSKTVYTQVVRSVDVSAVPGSQTTAQGSTSTYTIRVENTGNQTHDYEISVPFNSTQTTADLTNNTITSLDPGEIRETSLIFNNTKSLNGGSRKIKAEVEASVKEFETKSDSTTVSSLYTEDKVYGVSISSDETEQAINSNKNATYLLNIKNLGNTEETIELSKSVSKGNLSKKSVTLNSSGVLGDTQVIKFTQNSSEPGEVVITANSSGVTDTLTLNTRVAKVEEESVTNSDVDGSSTVTNSIIESSTITNSEIIINSKVNNSKITDSKINNTVVKNSDLTNINIEDGLVEDNQIKKGVVTVDNTKYELSSEDSPVTITELVSSDKFNSNIVGSSEDQTQITGENSNITLDMETKDQDNYVGGSMELQRSDTPPKDVDAENTNTSQYVRIKPSINVEESTEYSIITLSYSNQWIEEDDIDEDTVAIYRYDENNGEWVELVEEGNPSFCNGVEKNTEENYVRANVTKFSTYEIDGEKIQPPKENIEEDEGGTGGLDVGRTDKGVRELYLSGTNPSRTISQVQENDTIIVNTKPTNNNQSLKGFNTTAKKYLGSVSINIKHIGKQPDKASKNPNVYSYTEINLKNAENDEIKDSSLTFRVSKDWLDERDAEPEHVIGKKFVEEDWEVLETNHIKETDDYHEFRVKTSGFSVFSVGVKPRIETTNIADEEIKNEIFPNIEDHDFNKINLGKAGTNKVKSNYTTDTMNYKGETYNSEWEEEDYAVIQVEEHVIHIVGTHRYGTKAATMHYEESEPQETTLVHWVDENDNGEVELEEVEVIE